MHKETDRERGWEEGAGAGYLTAVSSHKLQLPLVVAADY